VTLARPTLVQSAQIVAAYEVQHGSALSVGIPGVGATYLELEDLDDFADAGGEIYLQALEDSELTTEPLVYSGLDRTLNRVLLSVAWTAELPLFLPGDHVWISPSTTRPVASVGTMFPSPSITFAAKSR
jgi:hypothetical protein